MPLVVILDSADVDLERDAVAAQLTKAGQDVAGFELRGLNIRTQEEAMAHEAIPEADVVVMWHTLKADAALLARMTAARAIVRVGVGYDNLDLVAAGALGLPVCNIPDYGTEEVADHALTLLLSLYRRVPQITAALAADAAAHGSEGVRDVARGTRRVRGQVGHRGSERMPKKFSRFSPPPAHANVVSTTTGPWDRRLWRDRHGSRCARQGLRL